MKVRLGVERRSSKNVVLAVWIYWTVVLDAPRGVLAKIPSIQEASSTVLQMHKLYTTGPPHDIRFYDILQVSPNATAAQITKSYRRLSRQFHPDKVVGDENSSHQLEVVQRAYDILKKDATRLPYHQYGLTDPNVAVALLLGPGHHHNHFLDAAHHELLQLMGFEPPNSRSPPSPTKARLQQQRVRLVAACLVERLRPLVESSVPPTIVAHQWAHDCDQWKRLPMGAHILRSIGRAYRHAGKDYLKQHVQKDPSIPVRQQWRQAKAFWTAFLATGKATLSEQVWTQQEQRRQRRLKRKQQQDQSAKIGYHSNLGDMDFDGSSNSDDFPTGAHEFDMDAMFSSDGDDNENGIRFEEDEEDMKYAERFKAQQTLLTSLQVEALWKVAKIDLDRTIRQACHMILSGQYFFFPSDQTPIDTGVDYGTYPSQGWVTSQGGVLHTEEALQRAAEALVYLGDIMVERSKVKTSWNK